MSERRPEAPGSSGKPIPKPVPRDPPDQQATADEDPWDVVGDPTQSVTEEQPDLEIPDTDEVSTGRRGAPHSGSRRPEHPVPDEPPARRSAGAPWRVTLGEMPATGGRSPAAREDTPWVYVPGSATGPSTDS
ncbi:hypothetical protein HEP87_62250 [Streptomyces sp. S1D4-11]